MPFAGMGQPRTRASNKVLKSVDEKSDAAVCQETFHPGLHPVLTPGDPPESKKTEAHRHKRRSVSDFFSEVPHPLNGGKIQRTKESEQRDIELHQSDAAGPDGQQ